MRTQREALHVFLTAMDTLCQQPEVVWLRQRCADPREFTDEEAQRGEEVHDRLLELMMSLPIPPSAFATTTLGVRLSSTSRQEGDIS